MSRALFWLLLLAAPARAAERDVVEVALGGSTLVSLDGAVGKVTLTDPSIADVQPAGADLLIIGRKVGETNLLLLGNGRQETRLVKVALPARAVQSELAALLPGEHITARAVGGALVLAGTVSAAPVVSQAEEIAMGALRSPAIAALGVAPNVINLLRVEARQQVQLEVKFAEVNRRSLREMGVDAVGGTSGGRFGAAVGGTAVGLSPVTEPNSPLQQFTARPNSVGAFFVGLSGGRFPFAATLNLLAQRDLARTLAEPTLVAMSGHPARFLAGGELPFEISTGLGNSTVEFKAFGIELIFTPTVLGDETMQLETAVSVSAPDPTVTIISGGVQTQGFKRRASSTTVRLRDGQSFAIAGLLSDEIENQVKKVPGLGDVPILGLLFSSKAYNRRETELVVVVTARLVDPIDGALPPLPGEDRVTDPTDLELFLLNVHAPDAPIAPARRAPGAPAARSPSGSLGFWR
ncbi:MAG: pilus assembly protein N-terminal domain-containing protein [Myxococcales bacterium]|nr:pilus assembly protein N-terminal domain-containing protein [Myxococcales bacterium]